MSSTSCNWRASAPSRPRYPTSTGSVSLKGPATPSSPPPSISAATNGNWRGTMAPPPKILPIPGQIMFLPDDASIKATSCLHAQLGNNKGAYEHPIALLEVYDKNGVDMCNFTICTSMGGNGIPAHYDSEMRKDLRLIEQKGAVAPDGTAELVLAEGSMVFGRETYARVGEIYSIELDQISEFKIDGRPKSGIFLSADSVARLKRHDAQIPPPPAPRKVQAPLRASLGPPRNALTQKSRQRLTVA